MPIGANMAEKVRTLSAGALRISCADGTNKQKRDYLLLI
jgi:hypothetical protein